MDKLEMRQQDGMLGVDSKPLQDKLLESPSLKAAEAKI